MSYLSNVLGGAALGLSLIVASGCQTSCLDDGFSWQQGMCPTTAASATDATSDTTGESTTTATASATATVTATATMGTMSNSGTMTGTMSATASESDTDATTGPGVMWCDDGDGDGHGDPDTCVPGTPGQEPPPGKAANGDDCHDGDPDTFPGSAENETPAGACMQDKDGDGWGDQSPDNPDVTPGSDCDDGDQDTFPGSAPNDDPTACMTDADGDDWGDATPSGPGVTPGTDCDDADANTFPGAAENEAPMDACMKDEDMDGWGDSHVPPGVISGADCYDTNADLNPGDRLMFSVLDGGDIGSVDVMTGAVAVFAAVDISMLEGEWSVISAAISPEDGSVYASNAAQQRLAIMDYCDGGAPMELAIHGRSICGLTFNAEGLLFGVDSGADELVQFDVTTGDVIDSMPLTLDGMPLNITACGMAFDCVTTQLLITDGGQSRILAIDPGTAVASVVADIDEGQWGAVGQEYDPVSKQVYTNNGSTLYQIEIDGSNNYTQPATLSMSLNDLAYGPTCN